MDYSWSWVIAVLLAAMASFISNLGVTLQKLHHQRVASESIEVQKKYSEGWMWRVGLFLVFFGSLADFAALSFGPQSLVAPLGSLTLVSNAIFAPLLLKETIGHWDVLSTALIIIGSSIAVVFGSHESTVYTVFELFSFYTRWDFILYAIAMAGFSTLLYLAILKIEKIESEEGIHSPRYLHYRALHRFSYPALSGTVGAQSVLFAKCSVELLMNTFHYWHGERLTDTHAVTTGTGEDLVNGTSSISTNSSNIGIVSITPSATSSALNEVHHSQNMFLYWQSYFILASMFATIFAQIKFLNDGLRRFDASYSVPVFTSFWIILSVMSGMIFYREWEGLNMLQVMMFALGVSITVFGVITLGGKDRAHNNSNQHHHHHHHHHDSDGIHAALPTEDEDSLAHTIHHPYANNKDSSSTNGHIAVDGLSDDSSRLDLDLEEADIVDAQHITSSPSDHIVNIGHNSNNPSSASSSSSSSHHSHHSHHHKHNITSTDKLLNSGNSNSEDASVAGTTKTVVVEAGQLFSEVFTDLTKTEKQQKKANNNNTRSAGSILDDEDEYDSDEDKSKDKSKDPLISKNNKKGKKNVNTSSSSSSSSSSSNVAASSSLSATNSATTSPSLQPLSGPIVLNLPTNTQPKGRTNSSASSPKQRKMSSS